MPMEKKRFGIVIKMTERSIKGEEREKDQQESGKKAKKVTVKKRKENR